MPIDPYIEDAKSGRLVGSFFSREKTTEKHGSHDQSAHGRGGGGGGGGKTRAEIETAWNKEKPTASGYRAAPEGWTVQELRDVAIAGHAKVAAGRYQSIAKYRTAREKGMGWRLLPDPG